jgi:hypothetical protein
MRWRGRDATISSRMPPPISRLSATNSSNSPRPSSSRRDGGGSAICCGRRWTEWAIGGHAAAERFVLLEPDVLLAFDPPARRCRSWLGDTTPIMASVSIVGRALRPPAPVRIGVERMADGGLQIGCRPRSRAGWHWLDGVDAPPGEDSERYRLTLTPSTGAPRTVECDMPSFLYSSALQAVDGAAGAAALDISLRQIGALAASLPAATTHFDL